jgi:5-oxoprolinase (ATP-hydrolysing)
VSKIRLDFRIITPAYRLATFGGAGGQHACEIARLLGIDNVLIHRYSSILSAYGLALSDRVYELQEPSSATYTNSSRSSLIARLDSMQEKVIKVLHDQGFGEDKIQAERYMNMRFDGTDTSIMVLDPSDGSHDFEGAFKRQHKEEFGFLLEEKGIIVDDLKVRGLGKTFDTLGETVYEEMKNLQLKNVDEAKRSCTHSVYFDEVGRVDTTPVYELPSLEVGDVVKGPAMIIDDTQTIVVVPKSEVVVTSRHLFIQLH